LIIFVRSGYFQLPESLETVMVAKDSRYGNHNLLEFSKAGRRTFFIIKALKILIFINSK
jgi:hypothetical protein